MKSSTRPILIALRRSYSAQAAPKASHNLSKHAPKISKLSNGVTVATVENFSPLSRLSLLFNAGSRYEDSTTEGVTHFLRSTVDLSSEKSTGFFLTKNIQQIGGSITCTSSREHLVYSLECTRNLLETGLEFLSYSCQPALKPWEVEDVAPRFKRDLEHHLADPTSVLMEKLHKAAYRNNLGNSLYMPYYKVGNITPEVLKGYVDTHLNPANMTIVGVGVDHEQLIHLLSHRLTVSKMPAGKEIKANPSPYHGGEIRVPTGGHLVHTSVVTEGVSMTSSDMLPLAVLQRALGTQHYVRYGGSGASKLAQAAAQVTSNPFAVSALNINYSDSGLFGFYALTEAKDAGKVIRAVASQFSKATKDGLTDKDIQKGKNQVKADVLMTIESGSSVLHHVGLQVALTGQVQDVDKVMQAIDKITKEDVHAVAMKVINGKASMAAVGNLSDTPYLDQLA